MFLLFQVLVFWGYFLWVILKVLCFFLGVFEIVFLMGVFMRVLMTRTHFCVSKRWGHNYPEFHPDDHSGSEWQYFKIQVRYFIDYYGCDTVADWYAHCFEFLVHHWRIIFPKYSNILLSFLFLLHTFSVFNTLEL